MRRFARLLLLAYAFAVPWEFSLELPQPFGPVARFVGVLLLLAAIPAILRAGRMRIPGPMQWLVLALFLWLCGSYFWTIDQDATAEKMRAYFQEMMCVWLVWEFADDATDLRRLLQGFVAGSWVLAAVTLASFASPETIASGQIRFFAEGLDPNDTARFLDLGFPFAALLFDSSSGWPGRLLALGYLPLGIFAVVLTASRGGAVAASVALLGSGILLVRSNARRVVAGALALPLIAITIGLTVPLETLARFNTIYEQLEGGNLNDRVNIWTIGWRAFLHAPVAGSGAGSFVTAAHLAPIDTAHNTALSVAVGGGLVALFLICGILALSAWSIACLKNSLFLCFATALLVWMVTSLTATVEENRSTWLLFALIALAGRLATEDPTGMSAVFSGRERRGVITFAARPLL